MYSLTRTVIASQLARMQIGVSRVESSTKVINGTDDDKLFQTERSGMAGYRFDNLPAGTYQVELNFAELRANFTPGKRVFDVSINGTVVLPGYDIVAAVGTLSADTRVFTISVPAGGNLQSAIDNARLGDEIVLQAGATYGAIMLRNKSGTGWLVIRSSQSGQLPAGTRVQVTGVDNTLLRVVQL